MLALLVIGGALLALLVFSIAGWLIGTYNTFVTAQQDLREMWSNIKTEYQRRADLILNLVETAKGAMRFEKETLTAVTQARAGFFGATKTEEMKSLAKMNTVFANLMGRLEQYPKLESISTMHAVMEELRTTENRINIARTDYNETVRDYNVLVSEFPGKLLATPFGFTIEAFFESEPEAAKAPKVSFAAPQAPKVKKAVQRKRSVKAKPKRKR